MKRNKVLVGMSGGVDSSVCAYILQKQGYEVTGLTLNVLGCKDSNCDDAKKICDRLGIKHVVLNLKEEFDEKIIKYFVDEYIKGRTPNPCVMCNREFKFEKMLQKADELGIKYVATGHYVKIKNINGRHILQKAKDGKKDQSYVLYRLSQEQLSRCIFPLGNYTKKEIRDIAKELGFENANKSDSQDICFVEDGNYSSLIHPKDNIKGDIVDVDGNVIGEHNGIYNYTIGQRKGIKISSNKPLYVVGIDKEKNRVIVGDKDKLFSKSLVAKDINWIDIPKNRMLVTARIRYHSKEALAIIEQKDDSVLVKFFRSQRAITPGQSVVFYKGKNLLGGGVIQ
ncbi:MAG: tRNA 2-thiouridine(34) synthase MnmA [Candidatus Dojkabacteria bacterium]|nr:tRNA 2-thiouridine(34) synthase MnmA [Candidatus Dojkabacteria bacterium]